MITCSVSFLMLPFIFSTRYKTYYGQKLEPIEEVIIEVMIAYLDVGFSLVVELGFSPSSLNYTASVTMDFAMIDSTKKPLFHSGVNFECMASLMMRMERGRF